LKFGSASTNLTVLSRIKKQYEKVITRLLKLEDQPRISPNTISLLGFLVAILASLLIYYHFIIVAVLSILLSGFLDSIDGIVARKAGLESKFGAFLDSVLDRYSDAVIIFSMVVSNLCSAWIGLFAIIGFLMMSYMRARGEALGASSAGAGIMERAERLLALSLILIASSIASDPRTVCDICMLVLTVLVHASCIQRFIHIQKQLRETNAG